jgi:hypothetical protein
MCLIVKKGTRGKILKEDLIVYKKTYILNGFHCYKYTCRSQYNGYVYSIGVLNEVKIKKSDKYIAYDRHAVQENIIKIDNREVSIFDLQASCNIHEYFDAYGEGFHFAVTPERLEKTPTEFNARIIAFTIPAGSRVIFDNSGLGITNKIILIK